MQSPDGDTETVVRDEPSVRSAEVSLQVTASRVRGLENRSNVLTRHDPLCRSGLKQSGEQHKNYQQDIIHKRLPFI